MDKQTSTDKKDMSWLKKLTAQQWGAAILGITLVFSLGFASGWLLSGDSDSQVSREETAEQNDAQSSLQAQDDEQDDASQIPTSTEESVTELEEPTDQEVAAGSPPVDCSTTQAEFDITYDEERFTEGFGSDGYLNKHSMTVLDVSEKVLLDGVLTDEYIGFTVKLHNLGTESASYRPFGEFQIETTEGKIVPAAKDLNLTLACDEEQEVWTGVSLVSGGSDTAMIFFPTKDGNEGVLDWQPEALTPDSIRFEFTQSVSVN